MEQDLVKIWSFEHDAWWGPDSRGYYIDEESAGLYERKEAEEIVHRANYGGLFHEAIVEVNQPHLKERIAALSPRDQCSGQSAHRISVLLRGSEQEVGVRRMGRRSQRSLAR